MEDVEEKIDALLEYREALDEEDREVFDMLVDYARKLARQKIHC